MTMTRGAEKILARMRELVDGGTWEMVPSHSPTIRLARELTTPNYAREPYKGRMALWGQETYTETLFITLVNGTVIRGYSSCPWVGRSDQTIPFWYAEMILNAGDPWTVVYDWARLKDERQADYNARQAAKAAKR
jgi:hypothetical protein